MDVAAIHAAHPDFHVSLAMVMCDKRISYRITHSPTGLVSMKPVNTPKGALHLIEFFEKNRHNPAYWGLSDQIGDVAFD